jgi:hypothetical protein
VRVSGCEEYLGRGERWHRDRESRRDSQAGGGGRGKEEKKVRGVREGAAQPKEAGRPPQVSRDAGLAGDGPPNPVETY